jgi:hypothetical protein
LSNMKDAVALARSDTQALHAKLQATTNKDHGAIRADAKNVASAAQELAVSLKTLAENQQADGKQHLRDAALVLEKAAQDARELGSAGDADVKVRNKAMLQRVRSATQKLSKAVAANRAAAHLIHS